MGKKFRGWFSEVASIVGYQVLPFPESLTVLAFGDPSRGPLELAFRRTGPQRGDGCPAGGRGHSEVLGVTERGASERRLAVERGQALPGRGLAALRA